MDDPKNTEKHSQYQKKRKTQRWKISKKIRVEKRRNRDRGGEVEAEEFEGRQKNKKKKKKKKKEKKKKKKKKGKKTKKTKSREWATVKRRDGATWSESETQKMGERFVKGKDVSCLVDQTFHAYGFVRPFVPSVCTSVVFLSVLRCGFSPFVHLPCPSESFARMNLWSHRAI